MAAKETHLLEKKLDKTKKKYKVSPRKRQNFKAVEKMEPREVKRSPS